MGGEGKDNKEEGKGPCNHEIQTREIGEIEGVPYCFHPKSPRGRTTMITK